MIKKVDIWSFGVAIYRIVFNQYPFKNVCEMLEINEIKKFLISD
jgi:hypothetical protein